MLLAIWAFKTSERIAIIIVMLFIKHYFIACAMLQYKMFVSVRTRTHTCLVLSAHCPSGSRDLPQKEEAKLVVTLVDNTHAYMHTHTHAHILHVFV